MTSGAAASASRVDHPLFARIWPVVAAHEAEAIRAAGSALHQTEHSEDATAVSGVLCLNSADQ